VAYGDTCGKWKMCFPQVDQTCIDAMGVVGETRTMTIDWTQATTSEKACNGFSITDCTPFTFTTWSGSTVLSCPVTVDNIECKFGTAGSPPSSATHPIPGSLWTGQYATSLTYYSRFYSVEYFVLFCSGLGTDNHGKQIRIYRYEIEHATATVPALSTFNLVTPITSADTIYTSTNQPFNNGVSRWRNGAGVPPDEVFTVNTNAISFDGDIIWDFTLT